MSKSIPTETANKLCKQIQTVNAKRGISLAKLQCWICVKCTQSNPSQKLFVCREGNRGCNLINKVFNAQNTPEKI